MKTIKFKTTQFELASDVNASPSHFQASIVKGDTSVDSVIAEAGDSTSITISEDGETVAVYNGYSTLFVVNYTKGSEIISVEMLNEDFQAQIDAISASVSDVASAQSTQDAAINDLAGSVSELTDSQQTQDAAIEDLAEYVAELVPEE